MKTTHRWKQGNHLSQHQALLHQALQWWFAYACQLTFPYILGEKLTLVTQEERGDDHLQSRTKEEKDPKKRRTGQQTTAPVFHPRPPPSGPKLILLILLGKLSSAFWRQFPRAPRHLGRRRAVGTPWGSRRQGWLSAGGRQRRGWLVAVVATSDKGGAEGPCSPARHQVAMWSRQSPALRAAALPGSGSLRELAGRVQRSVKRYSRHLSLALLSHLLANT